MPVNPKKRIAVIVWKWKYLREHIITAELARSYGVHQFDSWKASFTFVYQVVKAAVGQKPPEPTGDLLIGLRPESGNGEAVMDFLLDLIAHYHQTYSNALVYTFLHRSDGFGPTEVTKVYQQQIAKKCFLFSDGRDYIYFLNQGMGLLSELDGRFYREPPTPEHPAIQVANDQHQWVFANYFNQTWAYYEGEYHSKIVELQEDLLDYYLEKLEKLDQEIPYVYLQKLLKAHPELYLRLKSLRNHNILTDNEKTQLTQIERKAQKSYSFDDLPIYVQQDDLLSVAYKALVSSLTQSLFDPVTITAPRLVARRLLQDWQQHFTHLAAALLRTIKATVS